MRFGSICSGIEAASVAWLPLGWRCEFMSEIEAFPRAVLRHHYPETPLHGDFTTIREGEYGAIDLLVGGTPCQSFSIAGLRGGMADARGNLALEFLRLAQRLKPQYLLWENVPGVLSSNDGKDFTAFLDGLEEIGYVADVEILDAQYFGLAQRRRRVFVCAERAEDILKAKTLSSGLTIAQCLAEILRLTLAALSGRSIPDSENWTFDASELLRSLERRMTLFGLHRAEVALMLPESLGALLPLSGHGRAGLAFHPGNSSAGASKSSGDTRSLKSNAATEPSRVACLNTEASWKASLAESLLIASECITSTCESGTTHQKIFTCARTLLHIAGHITQSMSSSPCFWSAALSVSTALEAFTNYARQASSDLFTGLEWLQPWTDFVREAEPTGFALANLRAERFAGEVLPVSASLRGDTAPRREAREGVARPLAGCTPGGSGYRNDADTADSLIARCLNAHPSRSDGESETFICGTLTGNGDAHSGFKDEHGLITHALRADGFDASEDGTDRGTPLVPAFLHVNKGRPAGRQSRHTEMVTVEADTVPTLATDGHAQSAIAIPLLEIGKGSSSRGEGPNGTGLGSDGDPMFTLQAGAQHGVAQLSAVRRLTPTECCRLQGFPDTYLDIEYRGKPAADGPKYRALGNSMAVPCMRWIGRRIAMVHEVTLRSAA